MCKLDSDGTLFELVDMLFVRLDDLNKPPEGPENSDFVLGERTAYVECLEMIQATWERSNIPENIEQRYPIS